MPRDPTPASRPALNGDPPSAFERLAAFAVVALPTGVALARLAHRPTWREDAAILRDLALVGTGWGGGVSTALTQLATMIPLGSSSFRAALVSVIALGIAGRAAFAIALRLLRAAAAASPRPTPAWVAPGFAAIGVTGALLGPSFQLEATAMGGATVAVALVLVALALTLRATDPGAQGARGRDLVAAGALAGAAGAERPLAALAALAAVAGLLFTHRLGAWVAARWRPGREAASRASSLFVPLPRRALILAGVAGGVTLVIGLLPALVRPFAPGRALDLGGPTSSALGAGTASVVTNALGAWTMEMGWVPLALAGAGAVVLAARRSTRPGVVALGVLVLLDVMAPARLANVLESDVSLCLRALAILAIAIAAAVGLHECVFRLLRAQVPHAKPAAALLIAFQATVVALASEQASALADRGVQRGSEEWLDASSAALEARSVALVESVPKATRLWAAQLAFGHRPDVVVLPSKLTSRGGVASDLLAREPRAHGVVRALALDGVIDGFALSELADARSLHMEPDRSWDARTSSHAALDSVWLHVDPQPIGRNDRRRSARDSVAPLTRLLSALDAAEAPDAATTDVVANTLREQALVLAQLGEIDTARELAAAARRLGPTSRVGSPAATVLLAAIEATAPAASGSKVLPVRRTSLR